MCWTRAKISMSGPAKALLNDPRVRAAYLGEC
jgi:ABC-type branched-subunit amino acid transport system ATPase component